jgi:hypothetical protein
MYTVCMSGLYNGSSSAEPESVKLLKKMGLFPAYEVCANPLFFRGGLQYTSFIFNVISSALHHHLLWFCLFVQKLRQMGVSSMQPKNEDSVRFFRLMTRALERLEKICLKHCPTYPNTANQKIFNWPVVLKWGLLTPSYSFDKLFS